MTTVRRNPWLVGRQAPGSPETTLYCFPHSGGIAGEYVRWAPELPGTQVYAIGLPGRASRTREKPITDMRTLVRTLVDEVPFGESFVLFGHSFGALLAFEVARELRDRGLQEPERLVLSGCPAPQSGIEVLDVTALSDRDIMVRLGDRYGGIPPEVLDNAELLTQLAPAFRQDYLLLGRYSFEPGRPLAVPAAIFGGSKDNVPRERLEQWRELFEAVPPLRMFDGGHFYFREDDRRFFSELRTFLHHQSSR
ncbi:thioesterase II family protein [Amycolatopsis pigmentata]|uniref:Thioesterase II family protein n=1 Tax=Amycolatopsis pigmentata TaxID=450801 RepID=A0ABW5G3P0_9PSEU